MKSRIARALLLSSATILITVVTVHNPATADAPLGGTLYAPNPNGLAQTYDANGAIDTSNPFFQSLGTNGRACITCHTPTDGWTITPPNIQLRFAQTSGTDPLFRTVDGSNCNNLDVSSIPAMQSAYSLLLGRGLIRVGLPVPPNAQFTVTGVANYYGDCNSTTTLSMYRRPLPAANLRFLSTVMWDGRESTPPNTQTITFATNPGDLRADLADQALMATNGHAQATVPLTQDQQQAIVNFEMGIFIAQAYSKGAGSLSVSGATAGPQPLSVQPFFIGIDDPLGHNPFGTAFTPVIFNLFDAWSSFSSSGPRASIARGQAVFNSKSINISGVAGLNDVVGQTSIIGTCGTCHDTPNVGNHSYPAPLNIGISDPTNPLGIGYLPVYTLQNLTTGATVQTTDPGRAMITGKWADIGKVKGPVLRGLSARSPYFHNGAAATLNDVVNFYQMRFGIAFTEQEKTDLVNFLSSL